MKITKENVGFGLAELLIFAENTTIFSFLVLFLKSEGFSGSQTGIIMSLTMTACLIAQPIAGFICDKLFDIRKVVIVNMVVSMLAIGMIYFLPSKFSYVFACFLVYSMFGRYLPGLMDVYITKMSIKKSGLDYGFVRGMGSFGYASFALVIGWMISAFGYNLLFISHTVFAVLSIISLLRLPPLYPDKKNSRAKDEGFFAVISKLTKNKLYMFTVISILIIYCGFNGYGAYLPLYLDKLGGGSESFGTCVFVMAMSEIPILWNFYKINRKFSAEKLLIISMFAGILKITLPLFTSSIIVVIAIQCLQALSTGLFIPSVILFLRKLVPESQLSVGILLAASLYGGGSVIISNLVSGILIEQSGIKFTFACCSAAAIIGSLLLLAVIKMYYTAKNNGKTIG